MDNVLSFCIEINISDFNIVGIFLSSFPQDEFFVICRLDVFFMSFHFLCFFLDSIKIYGHFAHFKALGPKSSLKEKS